MNSLSEIIISELEDAVEIKNKKSLERSITLLLDNIAEKHSTEQKFLDINHRLDVLNETMRLGFENTNKRFEDMNKRFEDMNKRFEDMNKRFEDMNKRLDDMNKKIGLIIWIISLWMILFSSLSLFLKIYS